MSFFPHHAVVIEDYSPHYDANFNELTVKAGEVVIVRHEHASNGWSNVERVATGQLGLIPTGFFKYVRLRKSQNVTEDHKYELYYRNYVYNCNVCKKAMKAPEEKWHCLDYGKDYDEYNLCVSCFESKPLQYWIEEVKSKLSTPIVDEPVFTKMRRHPAEMLWLVSGFCVAQTLNNAFLAYHDRPCLGYRKTSCYDSQNKPVFEAKYTWLTFEQIHKRSLALGAGLQNIVQAINKNSGQDETKRGFVGICSVNRVEWFITDFALQLKGMVTVPLPKNKFDNHDFVDMAHIMNNAEVTTVVCSREYTSHCLKLVSEPAQQDTYVPTLKVIIQMEDLSSTNTADVQNATTAKELGIKLFSQKDVEEIGKKSANWESCIEDMPDSELATIVYTSGSTGRSKGAIITNKNFNRQITKPYFAFHPLVSISFCPLSHMSDRANVWNTLINGGRSGMFSGDMSLIFDDFQALQPTVLSSTPRLYNSIFAEYQKTKVLMESSGTVINEDELMSKFSSILGGRMAAMTTGGAATSQEVINFLRKCFKCQVYNGYASTEIGSISWIDVGEGSSVKKMVFDGVQIKLVDVPHLGYFSSDKPHPRGEICVKSDQSIPGYYRDVEKTKELIDEEGWYHSGDIGSMDENGKITIIDRLKNIFKLAQGEFVAPEPLENLYLSSEYIDQIFIYGNSMKTFLVAVVVPNVEVVKKCALDNGLTGSLEAICQRNNAVYKAILTDIYRIGKNAKIPGYEIPKGFIFELEKFTIENGKLTGPQKTCRPYLSKFYEGQLAELYEQLEGLTHADDLMTSIMEALGLEKGGGDLSLAEIGGDSISATRISAILEKKLNIRISAKDLLQNKSVSDIAELIRSGSSNKDVDVASEVQLDESIMAPSSKLLTVRPPELIENILLTGASGFLGGCLLEELLKNTHRPNCKIHCIVRANSDKEAEQRLRNNLLTMNINLSTDDISRVVVYAGDLSLPKLGLSDTTWNHLCSIVDTIYHNGAHVNFLLSYQELYNTNVASGIELLKMSVSGRNLKPLHFVSTIGVLGAPNRVVLENEPLENVVSTEYFKQLGGYSQSKYIAEEIFRIARRRNIPVSIFRPELIVGHSQTGHSNAAEWISRFICGVIRLGVAPFSNARVHMVTVDFVAKAIVTITNSSQSALAASLTEYNSFHVVNTNPTIDGVSISVNDMVKFIQSFGYNVKQVEYSEWFALLERELKENPNSENPLFAIASMFKQGFPDRSEHQQNVYDKSNLQSGLGDTVPCQEITNQQLFHKYLRSFISQKQIPP